jgi:hypothetical protein
MVGSEGGLRLAVTYQRNRLITNAVMECDLSPLLIVGADLIGFLPLVLQCLELPDIRPARLHWIGR